MVASFKQDNGKASDKKDWRESATPGQLKKFDQMFGKGGTHSADRVDVGALRRQANADAAAQGEPKLFGEKDRGGR